MRGAVSGRIVKKLTIAGWVVNAHFFRRMQWQFSLLKAYPGLSGGGLVPVAFPMQVRLDCECPI